MLAFLLSRTGLSLIAVALVVAVIGVHLGVDAHVKHELASAQAGWTHCQASVVTQNAAIKAQADAGAARVASAAKAVEAAQPVVQRLSGARVRVEAVKSSDASCPALLGELREIRKGVE